MKGEKHNAYFSLMVIITGLHGPPYHSWAPETLAAPSGRLVLEAAGSSSETENMCFVFVSCLTTVFLPAQSETP